MQFKTTTVDGLNVFYREAGQMHRLNSGHFAVEDCLPTIVDKMKDFYRRARAA